MRKNHLVVGIVNNAPVVKLWENSTIEEVKEEQFNYAEEANLNLDYDILTIYTIDPDPKIKELQEVFDLRWGGVTTDLCSLENAPKFTRENSFLVMRFFKEYGTLKIYRNTTLEQVKEVELTILENRSYIPDDDLVIFQFNSSNEKESATEVWNYSPTLKS